MGYYSDVLIAVAAACKDDLQAIVARARMENPSGYEKTKPLLDQAKITTVEAGAVLWLKLTGVKWYDGFPIVLFINGLFSVADDMGWPSLFIHIGEEHDDTEYDMNEPFADELSDAAVVRNEALIDIMRAMFGISRQITTDDSEGETEPWRP